MQVEVKYTYQDLLTTPDDHHRYEIFEGELIMTPAPTTQHQIAVGNLFRMLSNFSKSRELGRMLLAPLDVYFDEETVVEPDIIFIARDRLHIIDEQKVNGAPDVVVEVLSESTEQRDRGFKFKRYAKEGVKEYWVVDPMNRTLEIYQLGGKGFVLAKKFSGSVEVQSPYFAGLVFNLDEIWK